MVRPSTGRLSTQTGLGRPSTGMGRPSTGRPSTVGGRSSRGGRRSKGPPTNIDGLMFNVGFMKRKLKEGNYAPHVSRRAAAMLSAVIEYSVAELLELSSGVAKKRKRQTIGTRDINIAVRSDAELSKLLRCVKIAGTGVLPFIQPAIGTKTMRAAEKKLKAQPPVASGRPSRGRVSTGPQLVHPMLGKETPEASPDRSAIIIPYDGEEEEEEEEEDFDMDAEVV